MKIGIILGRRGGGGGEGAVRIFDQRFSKYY